MERLNLDFLSRPNELLSLKDLSTVAAASLICDSKEMKMAIDEVLNRHYPIWKNPIVPLNIKKCCLKDMSVKISETMSHIFNQEKGQISLPQVLKTEMEYKVLEKVEEMINWILYVIRGLKLDYKAVEKIYWTTDGNIDEDKIFRFFWLNQLVEEPVKWERFDNSLTLLQYLACIFGQDEFISLHRSDYISAIKPMEIENNDIVLTIMKSVIAYYNNLYYLISDSFEPVKFYIVNTSTVRMLSICTNFCFHRPFIFFWNHLDATEQFNYLETQSKTICLYINEAIRYGTKQSLKIMLFLMEKMNERQKYNFIVKNFSDVFFTFSRNKNYRKFCMPLVERFLPIVDASEKYNFIMKCAIICDISYQFDIELEIVKRSVKTEPIHKIIKPDFSSFIKYKRYSSLRVIETFFDHFNIPALKFIIKDESSESRKKDLISIGKMKFKDLIEYNEFKLLDNFLDEVLLSEAEKDKFKQDYNFLGDWINQCRFDIVDNVLIWMHGSASEEFKTPLKNLCCSSIRRDYEEIEKLLIWFFDAHGPLINKCQSKLELLNEFCCDLIYNVWFPKYCTLQNRDRASDISTKILIFSFSSEKEIQNFKRNVLANEEKCNNFFCEKEWNNWECNQVLSALDDFLNFCNLPKEKEHYIKSSLNERCRKLAFKPQELKIVNFGLQNLE